MPFEFQASPHCRGGAIDLTLSDRRSDEAFPRLVLVRRRGAYPSHPADGLVLFDSADLTDPEGEAWEAWKRYRFVLANSPHEGGLTQLELVLFGRGSKPVFSRARVRAWRGDQMLEQTVDGLTEVEMEPGSVTLAAGPTQLASLTWRPKLSPQVVTWHHPGALPASVKVPWHQLFEETSQVAVVSAEPGQHITTLPDLGDAWVSEPRLGVVVRTTVDHDRGTVERTIALHDRMPSRANPTDTGLEPGHHYYYRGFIGDGSGAQTSEGLSAVALATGRHGFARDHERPPSEQYRLYQLLPAVLRRMDEPTQGDWGTGPLRNFTEGFACGFDSLLSHAEALGLRHDLRQARADLLTPLSRYIGWDLDHAQDVTAQRLDVRFAPELYRSIGNLPSLHALITRASGLDVRIKEFVHNVAFTNAPEPARVWDLWHHVDDGTNGSPRALTIAPSFHGRPALAIDPGERLWIFGHTMTEQGLRLFARPHDAPGTDVTVFASATAERDPALLPVGDASPGEYFLLASVQRAGGTWDLAVRRLSLPPAPAVAIGPLPPPTFLTDHPGEDRLPCALHAPSSAAGELWLFWQSNRSGRPAIWMRRFDAAFEPLPEEQAGLPRRMTDGHQSDEMPSAVATDARVHLVWSRSRGSAAHLYRRVWSDGAWGAAVAVTDSAYRDRGPSSIAVSGVVGIYFDSDRPVPGKPNGGGGAVRRPSRIWRMALADTPEAEVVFPPAPVRDDHSNNEEPATILLKSQINVVFRSQQRGQRQRWTRTFDTDDDALKHNLGTFEDRAHYTYDTRQGDGNWYAGNAVGLFFTSTTASPEEVAERVDRMRAFVEPFRPEHARFVWVMPRSITSTEPAGTARDEHRPDKQFAWLYTRPAPPVDPRYERHKTWDLDPADASDPRLVTVNTTLLGMSRT